MYADSQGRIRTFSNSNITGITTFDPKDGTTFLETVKPISYNYDSTYAGEVGAASTAVLIGFNPTEVEAVYSDIVSTNSDNKKTIDYNSITALNSAAIIDILDKISSIESRLDALENP